MSGDRVSVRRLAVYGGHGVLPEEAALGQRFYIDLDAWLDLGPAGRSDDVAQTVSYADLAQAAAEIATGHRFRLVEGLAEAIAAAILARFPRIDALTVRIDKPGAPVPLILEGVGVEITRRRACGNA